MGKRLFVGNLPFSTTDDELRTLFSGAGAIDSAAVMIDRATGRSRGFGFVEMSTQDEAQRAISELNGRDLGGRAIVVNEARERTAGRPDRGFSSPSSDFGPDAPPRGGFRKEGGSRRGLRARKRSL